MTAILRALLAVALLAPVSAFAATYDLVIDRTDLAIEGQMRRVFSINGQIAGPTLRWKEGEDVTINVTNRLNEDTSIHWHGILLPYYMDGVPMVSFAGIKPGTTFTYRFKVRQSGTYWYHSHSGGQEQEGMYAPIVIEPAKGERHKVARDYVVMLSDHHPMSPGAILRKLKQEPGYFNDRKRTLPGLMRDLRAAKTTEERQAIISDRLAWGEMRMDPTDLADVTGYTFLVNGRGPTDNWTGLFRPGEKVRLRFINGSAMTVFDARIPGLKLKVVQADGNDVAPVDVDEFRIGVGETYDVIVEPREERAYTIEGQSIDRRGFARATLAPREGMAGPLPVLRPPGVLGTADMGHGSGGHGGMDHSKMDHSKMDHAAMGHTAAAAPDMSGLVHVPPVDAPAGAKVLSYTDLKRLDRSYALNPPDSHHRHPADRQHGEVHLVVRRPQILRAAGDQLHPGRDGAAGLQERDHDEPSDPSARALDGPRQRRGRGAAAQARGDRAARPHRQRHRADGRGRPLAVPLPLPVPHDDRDVPRVRGASARWGAAGSDGRRPCASLIACASQPPPLLWRRQPLPWTTRRPTGASTAAPRSASPASRRPPSGRRRPGSATIRPSSGSTTAASSAIRATSTTRAAPRASTAASSTAG